MQDFLHQQYVVVLCHKTGKPIPYRDTSRPKAYTLNPTYYKWTFLGIPNREPQEYDRNTIGIYLIFYYIPTIFLGFHVWGSQESPSKLFGDPLGYQERNSTSTGFFGFKV